MTDIVTYCDVNTCEECPRYADDCDGDKYLDRYHWVQGQRPNDDDFCSYGERREE